MKKIFWHLMVLIIAFILSAVLTGEYHSALSVCVGYAVGLGVSEALNRGLIE